MIVMYRQHMARKEIYLLVLGVTGLAQGMFFTYTVSVVSTIEKRFKLTSKQMGKFIAELTAGILWPYSLGTEFTLELLESLLDHLGTIIQASCVVPLREISTVLVVAGYLTQLPHPNQNRGLA